MKIPVHRLSPLVHVFLTAVFALALAPNNGTAFCQSVPSVPEPLPTPAPLPALPTPLPTTVPTLPTPLPASAPAPVPAVTPAPAAPGAIVSSPPPGPGPFWRATAIPAACVVADQVQASQACDVVNAVRLAKELLDATQESDTQRKIRRILAREAAEKIVLFVFPEDMKLDSKMDLVKSIYAAEQRQFDLVLAQVQRAMVENPQQAAILRAQALAHSSDVATLRQELHNEQRTAVNRAEQYLESHPASGGIQGQCRTACHQAIAAARGINVFD